MKEGEKRGAILNVRKLLEGLTMARSFFKLRNTSCFLINLRSAISWVVAKPASRRWPRIQPYLARSP